MSMDDMDAPCGVAVHQLHTLWFLELNSRSRALGVGTILSVPGLEPDGFECENGEV